MFQVNISKSYIIEYLKKSLFDDDELIFAVQCDKCYPDLVRVQFLSRHSKSAQYNATVRFNSLAEQLIEEWFCTRQTGPRQLGCCSHIAALLWHLGLNGAKISEAPPLSARHLFDYVEDSTVYSKTNKSEDDDNGVLYTIRSDDEID